MNKKKISVLMPSYNVQPYLKECLDSVLTQTYSELEIVIIDAGSTDGTLEILEKYSQNDKRIKIIHSAKKSYGYQLNIGMEIAKGEYVAIVETDDFVANDMMETLFLVAEREGADYVKGFAQLATLRENGQYSISNTDKYMLSKEYEGKVLNVSQMPEVLVHDIYLWNGLYRKEFLEGIRFNETLGAAFQDQGFLLRTLSKATRAVYIDKPVYYYRQMNPNSSIYNTKGFRYIYNEYQLNYEYLNTLDKKWHVSFYIRLMNQAYGRYNVMVQSGRFWDEAVEDIDKVRLWVAEIVKAGYLTKEILDRERWKKLLLFLEDAHTLYEYTDNPEMFDRNRVMQKAVDCKYIWLYGAGKLGRRVMRQLIQSEYKDKLCGFVISEKVDSVYVEGYPVKAIAEFKHPAAGTLFVIAVSAKYREEVITRLEENEFENYVNYYDLEMEGGVVSG